MRLPTVIRAGSQPTRRRQRPRLDPAALTRSHGLLPLRCTGPFLAEYLREQTATRPAELVLDLSEVTLVAAAGPALNNGDGINGWLHLIGVAADRPVARFPSSPA